MSNYRTIEKTQSLQRWTVKEPSWKLEEITLHPNTRAEIDPLLAFTKQENKEFILEDCGFNQFPKTKGGVAVNFYGEPGTGKGITAEAIAKALGQKIIQVTHGELDSPYPGECSKNYRRLFKFANEKKAVLFIDEAETALGARLAKVSQSADLGINSVRTTILNILNDFEGVVIFATNRFSDYDRAMSRRILFHVDFPLPDETMREKLWKYHLAKAPISFSYQDAAKLSEGLSGGHIANISLRLVIELVTKPQKERQITQEQLSEQIEKCRKILSVTGQKLELTED